MRGETRKRGTALISALLVVTVMSAVAVEMLGDMRAGIERSGNVGERDRAYWYAMGARDYADSLLVRAMDEPETAMRPDAPWLSGPAHFPIEGGMITARLRDAQTCFNLNSLVAETEPGHFETRPEAVERFDALLVMAGIPPGGASRIAAQAADWIDSDSRPGAGGVEDGTLARADTPYLAANTLIVETEEMRALPSMTPEIFAAISNLVCALPQAGDMPLNVNTLQLEQAVQLAALFPGRLSRLDAEAILLRRPSGGYARIEDFWADPVIAALEPEAEDLARVTLVSRWFETEIAVALGSARYTLEARVEADQAGTLNHHGQRFGALS